MNIKGLSRNFNEVDYSKNIDEIHTVLTHLTLEANFSSEIVEVVIPAGAEVDIPHKLRNVPKYRIILRKNAEADIIDGIKAWTDTAIYLKNPSANDCKITVMILRG